MTRSSILFFFCTILLVISQNEVHARNYLFWALGLEESTNTNGNRRLKYNEKTRARIHEARIARRQARKPEVVPPPPEELKHEDSETKATVRTGSSGKNAAEEETVSVRAGTSGLNLRAKVAVQMEPKQEEIVPVATAKAPKRRNAHTRATQKHMPKRIKTHSGGKDEAPPASPESNLEAEEEPEEKDVSEADGAAGALETVDESAAIEDTGNEYEPGLTADIRRKGEDPNVDTSDRTFEADGAPTGLGRVKNNAHTRMKEAHFQKKEENRAKRQAETAGRAVSPTAETKPIHRKGVRDAVTLKDGGEE